VHLFTTPDFASFCASHGIRVLERIVLHKGRPVTSLVNLFGSSRSTASRVSLAHGALDDAIVIAAAHTA